MSDPSAEAAAIFSAAHPLAIRLIDWMREQDTPGSILEIAPGSGRNTRALERAGFAVTTIPDERPYTQIDEEPGRFAALLSTHGYLHGATAKVRAGLAEAARVLAPGAIALVSLGHVDDVRFGFGEQIDAHTFAPGDGPEMGIPHAYFDEDGVREVMRPFDSISLEAADVDEIVGRWAHAQDELPGKVHWFVEGRRRA